MHSEELEVYPIEHRGKVYSIITATDMTFREVRGLLDWLDGQDAFRPSTDDGLDGTGNLFTCEIEGVTLEVDVQGLEVLVLRRSGPE